MVLGLIPARGGSKGIPRKNLAPLAGRPLLAWTVDAARASSVLDRTVVSTDDPEIAAVAQELGAEVLERPAALAADDTPMSEVVRHALEHVREANIFVLLQPTSPLRPAERIDQAVELLTATGADGVVSVVEVPHPFRPQSLLRVVDGRLEPLEPGAPTLRQHKDALLARNGPAVLARWPATTEADLYGGDLRPLLMAAEESVDVDGPFDLAVAEALLAGRELRR